MKIIRIHLKNLRLNNLFSFSDNNFLYNKIFKMDSNKKFFYPGILIKYLFIYGFIFLILLSGSGCSKAVKKSERDFRATDDENITYLLNLIEKVNANSPQSFNTNFDVEGQSGKQKFKASGNAQFNNNPKIMRIVFHDAVFKSPITEIIREGDVIKFYFPFDKILYVDNVKTINLKSYSNLDLDFNLISDLSTGRIPVIKNFSVKKGLEARTNSEIKANKLIILENEEYYETISFIRDIPDKILCLNKNTKGKIEIYLNDPVIKADILFYKTVRIISLSSDLNITIQFNSTKFNIPVDLENIVKINLPKDVKLIKRE